MNINQQIVKTILICGDRAVGKTTISKRLDGTLNTNKEYAMTLGIDLHRLRINNGYVLTTTIWDLGSQFKFFQGKFFGNVGIIIYVYSVDDYESFQNIKNWMQRFKDIKPLKIYLLANKIDLDNYLVNHINLSELTDHKKMSYFEISALKGINFENFSRDLVNFVKENFYINKKQF